MRPGRLVNVMQHNDMRDAAGNESSALLSMPHRPRALLWIVFVLALLFALLLPLVQLWRASVTPLEAQACLWHALPCRSARAGRGHAARRIRRAAGSWTRAVVEWDMVSMRMGIRRATTAPSSAQNAGQQSAIAIPLALDMAGAWAAHVLLQAPGRPDWTATLTFTALGSDQGAKTPMPTGLAGCAKPPAQAGASAGGTP